MRLATMLGTLTLLAAPIAALSLGCDSAEEGAPVQSPYANEDGFCDALAKAICNDAVVQACYGSADSASLKVDKGTCITQASRSATCNPGNMAYDKSGAESCVEKAKQIYSDGQLTRPELEAYAEACAVVFNRGGGVGSSCNFDNDCDAGEGLACVAKPGEAGSCQAPLDTAPGAKCDGAGAVCGDAHYCNVEAGSFCVERPNVNEPCSDQIPCKEDAHCVAGTCLEKDANGSPCTLDDECMGGFCVMASGEATGDCAGVIQLYLTSAACDPLKP